MAKLLLLGTGGIAGHHIAEFAAIPECKIVACVDALPGRAEAFAAANGIAHAFDGLDAAIGWGKFDAAINCTPDGVHMATTLALLAAGKHVFCEKPLAPNHPDALRHDRGGGNGRPRQHGQPDLPQLAGAAEGARHGRGRRARRAAPCRGELPPELAGRQGLGRLAHRRTTGCGGCRPSTARPACSAMSASTSSTSRPMARPTTSCACRATSSTFHKAEGDRIGDYELDANDSVAMTARLASGALATIVATRFATGHANDLTLARCTAPRARCRSKPTARSRSCRAASARTSTAIAGRRSRPATVKRNARRFADALKSGKNGDPSFRRAADIQRVIDAIFESAKSGKPVAVG